MSCPQLYRSFKGCALPPFPSVSLSSNIVTLGVKVSTYESVGQGNNYLFAERRACPFPRLQPRGADCSPWSCGWSSPPAPPAPRLAPARVHFISGTCLAILMGEGPPGACQNLRVCVLFVIRRGKHLLLLCPCWLFAHNMPRSCA